jgi:photosystem II stability/assembly factor-like uncharacterized protein
VWVATCGWVWLETPATSGRYKTASTTAASTTSRSTQRSNVVAGSVASLYRSTDSGTKFGVISDAGLVINSVVLHPKRPDRIVLGIEGDGVYVSEDRGTTFTRSSEGLFNLRITTIAPDPFERNRVYAAVVFGGAASGIYRSNDAGKSWERASKTPLPEVLSLTIASEADAEVKFLAGTEKGFFWSNDGEQWTQAEPSGFPIRVDKIVRFNRLRSFAATAEGVFTTKDGGRNWYRLGGATNRAVDIAIGAFSGKKALYALTAAGLEVFDGGTWFTVADAPSKGRSMAIRTLQSSNGGMDHVFIAGASGVKAGTSTRAQWRRGAPTPVRLGAAAAWQQRVLLSRHASSASARRRPTETEWSGSRCRCAERRSSSSPTLQPRPLPRHARRGVWVFREDEALRRAGRRIARK